MKCRLRTCVRARLLECVLVSELAIRMFMLLFLCVLKYDVTLLCTDVLQTNNLSTLQHPSGRRLVHTERDELVLIVFFALAQVNPITGYRRDARRIVNPIGSNPGQAAVQWEWFDGNDWEPYPPEISVRVEAARAAGEAECDFTTLYGQDYRIEFGVDAWQVRRFTGWGLRAFPRGLDVGT